VSLRWNEQQLAKHLEKTGVPGRRNEAVVSDPPFALSPITLDLPPPISVNRIWRKTKSGVIKSKDYEHWIKRADAMLVELGQLKGVKPVPGKFVAQITVRRMKLDLDNSAKVVLDFLQSRMFITNDSLCEELTLRWGEAPTGCRVIVRSA
jgi:crossover junction endodeoxyribonuclease RusA